MSVFSQLKDLIVPPPQAIQPQRSIGWPGYYPDINLISGQLWGMPFAQTLQGTHEEIPQTYEGFVEQAYKSNAIVFACMRARQSLFSEARFRFRRVRNGKPGDLFGTAALAILEEPWPGATMGDLLSIAITDHDAGGGAFLVRRGNSIRRLRPSWTTFVAGGGQIGDVDAQIIGYVYHPGGRGSGRDPVTFLAEDVAYWPGPPDPTSQFRGLPWLAPVIREIVGDSATTSHKLKFFENGATPNLAVTLDADISLTDAREWIELFKQDHEGATNAYKTLFLGGGAKPVPVGSSLKDIDYKAIQGAGETRIAAAAGVPPIIVGLSEGLAAATYSNYGQARRAFADLTMRPLWRSFAGALSQIIQVPPDAELWYDDSDISFLQEDVKDAADILAVKVGALGILVRDGWTPESAKLFVASGGDMSLLEHTGLFSVQLQPPMPDGPPQIEAPPPVPQIGPGRSVEDQIADSETRMYRLLERGDRPAPIMFADGAFRLDPQLTVHLPEQGPPVVNVTMPEQAAPVVNITEGPVTIEAAQPADVTVNVPEQPAPNVTFEEGAIQVAAPDVTVEPTEIHVDGPVINMPEPRAVRKTPTRNDKGQITSIIEEPV